MKLIEKRAVNQAHLALQEAIGLLQDLSHIEDNEKVDQAIISVKVDVILDNSLNEVNECLFALKES